MRDYIYSAYAFLFGRPYCYKFNKLLYMLSLRGLGILNYRNDYLNGEIGWLKSFLKNKINPVVIDVGANVGNFSKSVFFANQDAIIHAFEPHPKTYNDLLTNIKACDNFHPNNLGVGDKEETLALYDYANNDGSSHASLYKEVITTIHGGNSTCHTVGVITLDEYLKKKNIDLINILKIDTEGNELNVLHGVREYLSEYKIQAILFEFNEMNIVSKTSFKDFWNTLESYELYRILPNGKLLRFPRYSPIYCEIYAYQNIVAILKK